MVAPPLSADALTLRAELVVEATVLSRSDGRAMCQVHQIIKGTPQYVTRGWRTWFRPKGVILAGYRVMPSEPRLGEWWNEGAFSPGNRIRAYLVWDARGALYEAVWWNAVEVLGP